MRHVHGARVERFVGFQAAHGGMVARVPAPGVGLPLLPGDNPAQGGLHPFADMPLEARIEVFGLGAAIDRPRRFRGGFHVVEGVGGVGVEQHPVQDVVEGVEAQVLHRGFLRPPDEGVFFEIASKRG